MDTAILLKARRNRYTLEKIYARKIGPELTGIKGLIPMKDLGLQVPSCCTPMATEYKFV